MPSITRAPNSTFLRDFVWGVGCMPLLSHNDDYSTRKSCEAKVCKVILTNTRRPKI